MGMLAAGLVDESGESVDHAASTRVASLAVAPALRAYEIRLSAAHWQIVMRDACRCARLGNVRQLWVQAEELGYVVQRLTDGYVLVLVCRPEALASVSKRALRQCEVEIAVEAGWPLPAPEQPCWTRTRAKLTHRGSPTAVYLQQRWLPLDGAQKVPTNDSYEHLYQAHVNGFGALELVREATGSWYAGMDTRRLLEVIAN